MLRLPSPSFSVSLDRVFNSLAALVVAGTALACGGAPPRAFEFGGVESSGGVARDAVDDDLRSPPHFQVTVYGYQRSGVVVPNAPRFSHTWGIFEKIEADDSVLSQTISWFTRTPGVTIRTPPLEGSNLTHGESLALGRRLGATSRTIGTIPITEELWDAALRQARRLESGTVLYKMDMRGETNVRAALLNGYGGYTNCIYGLADSGAEADAPLLDTGRARGFEGSRLVLAYFDARFRAPSTR